MDTPADWPIPITKTERDKMISGEIDIDEQREILKNLGHKIDAEYWLINRIEDTTKLLQRLKCGKLPKFTSLKGRNAIKLLRDVLQDIDENMISSEYNEDK